MKYPNAIVAQLRMNPESVVVVLFVFVEFVVLLVTAAAVQTPHFDVEGFQVYV